MTICDEHACIMVGGGTWRIAMRIRCSKDPSKLLCYYLCYTFLFLFRIVAYFNVFVPPPILNCVSLTVVLTHWRRDRNRLDSYRVSRENVPESPIYSGVRGPWQQQRRTPCIVMKNERFCITKCRRFLLSAGLRWCAGTCTRRQCLPSAVIPYNEHYFHSTLCRAPILWTKIGMLRFIWLAFQVWFVWASPGFVHSDDSSKKVVTFSLVPVQQEVLFLHLGNFMGYPTS